MQLLKLNDTTKKAYIYMVSSSDHVTPVAGLSPTVTISKNGAAFGSLAGSVAELAGGVYAITLSAGDVDTLGMCVIRAVAVGADDAVLSVIIVNYDPYSATNLGLTNLNATISSRLASADISLASGKVTVGTNDDKTGYTLTQAFPTNFDALGINASGHISRVTVTDTTTVNADMRGTDGALTSFTGVSTEVQAGLTSQGYTTARASNLDRLTAIFSNVVGYLNEMIDVTTEDYARFTANALETSPVADVSSLATSEVAQAIRIVTDAVATMLEAGATEGDSRFTVDAVSKAPVADVSALEEAIAAVSKLQRADKKFLANQMLMTEEGTETVLMSKDLKNESGTAADPKTEFVAEMVKTVE